MRKVLFFMMVSVDGFFEGPNREIDWHVVDEEFNEFAIGQLDSVDVLLFGRTTYEMMASYWPTPAAAADDPSVAGKMNSLPKVVFSRTLPKADWQNTRLVKQDVPEEVARLKAQPGKDILVAGSGQLIHTLMQNDLVDRYQLLVYPVVLGSGKRLFKGTSSPANLELTEAKSIEKGVVLMIYEPERL